MRESQRPHHPRPRRRPDEDAVLAASPAKWQRFYDQAHWCRGTVRAVHRLLGNSFDRDYVLAAPESVVITIESSDELAESLEIELPDE
jgi:hypothetical protein